MSPPYDRLTLRLEGKIEINPFLLPARRSSYQFDSALSEGRLSKVRRIIEKFPQ